MPEKQTTKGTEARSETAADDLGQLAELIERARNEKGDQQAALREVEAALGKLRPKDYPELADSPVVLQMLERIAQAKAEQTEDPPGTLYNKGTLAAYRKPWTWRDLNAKFPTKTFTPNETIPVTFDGLMVWLIADQEITCPSIFYDLYMQRKQALKAAHQHAAFLMGGPDSCPADPSIISADSLQVRAHAEYTPGGRSGFIPNAGPLFTGFGTRAEEKASNE